MSKNRTLNAGVMLAIRMSDIALKQTLDAKEITWSRMEIDDEDYGDYRRICLIGGLICAPGTNHVYQGMTTVRLSKNSVGFWETLNVDVMLHHRDGVQVDNAGNTSIGTLEPGIASFTVYTCDKWKYEIDQQKTVGCRNYVGILPAHTSELAVAA